MSDERRDPTVEDRSIAEALARKTKAPVEQVAEIYARESAELERTSRIKKFIGVIATRRTQVILGALSDERS